MLKLKERILAAACGLALLVSGVGWAEEQPLTMYTYCELTKRLYQLSEIEMKERVSVAEELRADKKRLTERFEAIRQQYQSVRSKLYGTFETNSGAFGQFSHENKDSIAAHLDENPALRNEIEDLEGRIKALADRIESLLSVEGSGGAQ